MVRRDAKTWVAQPTTVPVASRCGTCRADTLSGWFDALTIAYDRQPLSAVGEALALVRGARTFLLFESHVHLRKAHSITSNPVPRFGYVIREHLCGIPVTEAECRPELDWTVSDDKPDF